jgi:lysine-specific demethylase 8
VIEGALDGWGARSWTIEGLKLALSDAKVRVQARHGPGADDFEYRDVPFDGFAASVQSGDRLDYLAGCPILDLVPGLWTDIEVPLYVGSMTTSPRAFIGPRGAITPLHFDRAHGLSAQFVGRKKVVVVTFRRRDVLRHPDLRLAARVIEPLDVESTDARGPNGLAPRERWETTVGPGDLLYLPWRRHHWLRALDLTISLSFFWENRASRMTETVRGLFERRSA